MAQDVTSISQAAGLGVVILSCCTPAAIEAINLLKERVAQARDWHMAVLGRRAGLDSWDDAT